MNMKRPLMYAAGGFVLGEVCFLLPVGLSAGIPVILTAGVCYLRMKRKVSGRNLLWWILPLFLVLGMGRMYGDRMETRRAEEMISRMEGQRLKVSGTVASIQYGERSATLKLSHVILESGEETVEYLPVLAYMDREEISEEEEAILEEREEISEEKKKISEKEEEKRRLRIGMRVSVRGELEGFLKPGNPGEFDYGAYYHAIGIEGRIYGEDLKIVGEEYSPYSDGIYRIKRRAGEILRGLCSPEDQGVFQAVVLGDKSELSGEIRDLYQKNGISHLLAVSGLHVSMIGMGLYHVLRKWGFSFGKAGGTAACITISYGVLAGGSASVVRAVVMICLQLLADRMGRTYDMLSAMAAAALLLLFQSPAYLFQSGFQLSFGAVLAIGAVMPVLSRWMGVKRGWGQAVLLDAVIQIVTYPVIVYHFFEYPVYGMILNLLVVPLMGYVLLSGLAGIFLGAAGTWIGLAGKWLGLSGTHSGVAGIWTGLPGECPGAAGILPQPAALRAGEWAIGTGHYILVFYQWLCTGFQKLPGAVRIVGRPALWQIGVYVGMWLAVLAAAWKCGKKDRRERKREYGKNESSKFVSAKQKLGRGCVIAAVMAVGCLVLRPLPPAGLSAAFLDVGQGDGICLRTKETVVLVDGGSSDKKRLGEQVLEPFLKSQGIAEIDYAVVSHGDQDHISGLTYLMESECGIKIEHLVLPWLGKGDEAYDKLQELAERMGAKIHWMKDGDYIQEGKLKLNCLYAGEEEKKEDRNEHSLLIQAVYGEAGILLTGDMSAEGEQAWLEQEEIWKAMEGESWLKGKNDAKSGQIQVQVLKVAHHGSKYSSCREFLKQIQPDCAVISCGEGNRYGHPSPETLERMEEQRIEYMVTMEDGAVIVETDGEKVKMRGYRNIRG